MRLVELLIAIVVMGGFVWAILLRNKRSDTRKADLTRLQKENAVLTAENDSYYKLLFNLYGIAQREGRNEPLIATAVENAISTHPKFKHLLTTDGEQS
jgi:hypothetical protein